eukprot:6833128-Prymnesium_polylepis.1
MALYSLALPPFVRRTPRRSEANSLRLSLSERDVDVHVARRPPDPVALQRGWVRFCFSFPSRSRSRCRRRSANAEGNIEQCEAKRGVGRPPRHLV